MSSWIFRANPGRFRIHDYLRDVGYVEYLQREKVEEGDIIYLYITGKAKRVEYKMVVERANIPFVEAEDDSSYSLRKPIETFLVSDQFVEHGYVGKNGRPLPMTSNRRLSDETSSYIEGFFK